MEPNCFADPDAIQHRLLLHRFAESNKEEETHEEEMEAKKPALGVPNQQIACKNEKKEEAPAMSAEDIFSDTMELACYLHRRVQEIGKQFRHRPFRIETNEKRELLSGFLQGLSCASELSLGSAIAKACEPGELAILRKNAESYPRAPSLAEEKPSSEPCFFNRDLNVCAEMKESTTFNLYDNGFGGGKAFDTEMKGCTTNHLYDSRPNEARACNTEEAHVLSLTDREEYLPFSSENACDSAHLSQRIGDDASVLSSKHREGKLPILSENACVYMCRGQRFHIQDSVMWDASPKHVSDVNFISFQEAENLNTCLDAASCPALRCTEGMSPHSQCSTPSHNSSEHLLCHAPSDLNITEHISLDLKLPSLQDHAISDAEYAVVPCLQKSERDFGHSEHSSSCVVGNHMPFHAGLQGDPVLPESVRKQGTIHTQITHSQAVAENSSPHSDVLRSMSSVDSSECGNCGTDAGKGHVVTERPGSRKSNKRADGNKSEEIDAMSEATHLDTHRKENDEDGTKNDALDLLLDAIRVTSGDHLETKQRTDACRSPSSHPKKQSSEERKQASLAKMFQATKKVNDQSCLPERVYGRMHPGSNSSHRIQDNIPKRSSPELLSNTVTLHVGIFPIVRKRSNRCPKTVVMEEPSRNSISPVVRFKSLQAVSEISHTNNIKGGKKLAANKHEEGKKVLLVNMQEREKISQSCLNGKRERTWEKQQDPLGKEDNFSKQEKTEKITDGDDLQKDRGKEQLPAMLASEGDEEEQGVLSRRARLQILPNRFSDSVLQPWKKGDRRKS